MDIGCYLKEFAFDLNVQRVTFGAGGGLSVKIIQKMLVECHVEGWVENKHLQLHPIPL